MSYNLVQIFDKNGEKIIILFDNLIKIQEKISFHRNTLYRVFDHRYLVYPGIFGEDRNTIIWPPRPKSGGIRKDIPYPLYNNTL